MPARARRQVAVKDEGVMVGSGQWRAARPGSPLAPSRAPVEGCRGV